MPKPQPMNPLTGQPVVTTEGDIVSHWLAKNAYVFMEFGFGFRQSRRELCAHERRDQSQDPEGGPG